MLRKLAVLIRIALTAGTLLLEKPNLEAATEGTTKFDGVWSVTLDVKMYVNPDGSKAQPFVRRFPVTVKNGILYGEVGPRGKPSWYQLSGKIEPDGTAALHADLITGSQEYNFTTSNKELAGKATPYTYSVVARFDNRHGTGHSTDQRQRFFTFDKQ
jgi:hypothetical protein